jgi:hypothetical protein
MLCLCLCRTPPRKCLKKQPLVEKPSARCTYLLHAVTKKKNRKAPTPTGRVILILYTHASQISDTEFSENRAITGGGGGISASNVHGTIDIVQSSVLANSAMRSGGGGIYVQNCLSGVHLTACNVSANTALQRGGGLLSEYTVHADLVDSTMQANTASEGGAVYFSSEYLSDPEYRPAWVDAEYTLPDSLHVYGEADVLVSKSLLRNNKAASKGGAMVLAGLSTAAIHDSRILENTAQQKGGGIAAIQRASVALFNSEIARNVAANCGGGILWASTSTMTVNGIAEIAQNMAGNSGVTDMSTRAVSGSGAGICLSQRRQDVGEYDTGSMYGEVINMSSSLIGTSAYEASMRADGSVASNKLGTTLSTDANACSQAFESNPPLFMRSDTQDSTLYMSGNIAELGGGAVYVDCVPATGGAAVKAYADILHKEQSLRAGIAPAGRGRSNQRVYRTSADEYHIEPSREQLEVDGSPAHEHQIKDSAVIRKLNEEVYGVRPRIEDAHHHKDYDNEANSRQKRASPSHRTWPVTMVFTHNKAGYGDVIASSLNATVVTGAVERGQMPGEPLHGTVWLLDSWGQRAQKASGVLPYTIRAEVCVRPCNLGGELLATSYYGFNSTGMSALEKGSRMPILWPSNASDAPPSQRALAGAGNSSLWSPALHIRLFVEVDSASNAVLEPLLYTVGRRPCEAGSRARMVDDMHHVCSECEAGSFSLGMDTSTCLRCPVGVNCRYLRLCALVYPWCVFLRY